MAWEIVVGLETHAQLATRSKIFSGAATAFGAAPNTQACAVDVALPGVLPVLNRAAVDMAIRFGLAVGATIRRRSVFARKNYFYPDLPKGYQISQYEEPIATGGWIEVPGLDGADAPARRVGLTRIHMEEDAGKSIHDAALVGSDVTHVDLNRAGIPLLEIVSEPDLRSPAEAAAYLRTLRQILREDAPFDAGEVALSRSPGFQRWTLTDDEREVAADDLLEGVREVVAALDRDEANLQPAH